MSPTRTRFRSISDGTVIFEWLRAGVRLAPFVPVRLRHGGASVTLEMLVDTGADISVLPTSLLGRLGLERSALAERHAVGFGGSGKTWRAGESAIQASIGVFEIGLPEVDFVEIGLPAILGRDALFGPLEMRMLEGIVEFRRRK